LFFYYDLLAILASRYCEQYIFKSCF